MRISRKKFRTFFCDICIQAYLWATRGSVGFHGELKVGMAELYSKHLKVEKKRKGIRD